MSEIPPKIAILGSQTTLRFEGRKLMKTDVFPTNHSFLTLFIIVKNIFDTFWVIFGLFCGFLGSQSGLIGLKQAKNVILAQNPIFDWKLTILNQNARFREKMWRNNFFMINCNILTCSVRLKNGFLVLFRVFVQF